MPLYEIKDLKSHQDKKSRLMGLDVGDKTIGIALADITWQVATPLTTLARTNKKADITTLLELVEKHQVIGVIIGLPVNMNGTYGPQAAKIQEFAKDLMNRSNMMVTFWDERLSTVAVNRTLLEADMSRKRRSQVIDKLAATFILQGALDRLRQMEIILNDSKQQPLGYQP
jgi:putative holliday junction resolvase